MCIKDCAKSVHSAVGWKTSAVDWKATRSQMETAPQSVGNLLRSRLESSPQSAGKKPAADWKLRPAIANKYDTFPTSIGTKLFYRSCLLKHHYRITDARGRMANRSTPSQSTLITLPDAVDLIRFEKNLLQIGFFGAHERRSKLPDSTRRIEQWVNRDGKKIKVSAEFRASEALGLPSTSDRDKYMAFMKLLMETKLRTGLISNPVRFSGYSLLKVLGQCDSGENYEALNSWGMRMADTTITSEQIIYSSVRKRYMNKTVHVFRSFTRLGSSNLDGSGKTDTFEVELEDWLLENLNESFVVPEDFNRYRKLVRPTAKGIFVYLYLWFFASQGKEVEKDYNELCALLNVRAYEHASKIRETMGLSLNDLVEIGYLKSWDIRHMSSKAGYKLVLAPGRAMKDVLVLTQRKQLAFAAAQVDPTLSDTKKEAIAALIEQGVSPKKATELAQALDPQTIIDRVEYVSHQFQMDHNNSIKNPAGFLISFLESEQEVPRSFTGRRRRLAAAKERKEAETSRRAVDEITLERLQAEEEYQRWCDHQAAEHLQNSFSPEEVKKQLAAISSRLRKDPAVDGALKRMTPEVRQAQLEKQLRKEVVRELQLPPFNEWLAKTTQRDMF